MRRARSATELMRQQIVHPWNRGRWEDFTIPSCQSIGYLIDWLDSRPDQRAADLVAINDLRNSLVVVYAADLCGRRPYPRELWSDDSRYEYDHRRQYSPFHHVVVGYLEPEELPRAQEVYERLLAVEPSCMSGYLNLAELCRRAGALVDCESLLREGLRRAELGGGRHGVADLAWTAELRVALMRLGADADERADDVLVFTAGGDVTAAGKKLEALLLEDADGALFAAHAAFGRADPHQRIVLGAAMRRAGVRPLPPPSAYASFAEAMEARRASWT